MTANDFKYGFRVVGPATEPRRPVDWGAAFRAHAECDPRSAPEHESYLSAFTFGRDFADYLTSTGSTKAYPGPCWSPYVWADIDRAESAGGIAAALDAARRIAVALSDTYGVDDAVQLWFFSGSKGFHAGVPTCLWEPSPGLDFHRICRRLSEGIAEAAGVQIDTGVYDKVRIFRAPNSRHPKTGRHKVFLSVDELLHLSAPGILDLAAKPRPFEIPDAPTESGDFLVAHWDKAGGQVRDQAEAKTERRVNGNGSDKLNRATLAFIREGATAGDRHRLLYSAAANLAELGCRVPLAYALLSEAALDSGLTPADVRRQIECGIASTLPGVAEACAKTGGTVVAVRPASVEPVKETLASIAPALAETRANVSNPEIIASVAVSLEARRALMAAQAAEWASKRRQGGAA